MNKEAEYLIRETFTDLGYDSCSLPDQIIPHPIRSFHIETIAKRINDLSFGTTNTIIIDRNADVISDMYLKIMLPKLVATNGLVSWFNLGQQIIKSAQLSITGTKFDKKYDIVLNGSWQQRDNCRNDVYNKLIGNVPELTELASEINSYVIFIPLHFSLDEYQVPLLPINFIDCDQISLTVVLRDFNELIMKTKDAVIQETNIIQGDILLTYVSLEY